MIYFSILFFLALPALSVAKHDGEKPAGPPPHLGEDRVGPMDELIIGLYVSDLPSVLPSDYPSMAPSDMPSDYPSSLPSDAPSSMPSDAPSSIPSDAPSSMPSDAPSSIPSDAPSSIPSDAPSNMPSDSPSTMPSDSPSFMPSDAPSSMPSDAPSSMPSDSPSIMPSGTPSQKPSSLAPTGWPVPPEPAFDAAGDFVFCGQSIRTGTIAADMEIKYQYDMQLESGSVDETKTSTVASLEEAVLQNSLTSMCQNEKILASSMAPDDSEIGSCGTQCYRMEGRVTIKVDVGEMTSSNEVYCYALQSIFSVFDSGVLEATVTGVDSAVFDTSSTHGLSCSFYASIHAETPGELNAPAPTNNSAFVITVSSFAAAAVLLSIAGWVVGRRVMGSRNRGSSRAVIQATGTSPETIHDDVPTLHISDFGVDVDPRTSLGFEDIDLLGVNPAMEDELTV